MAVPGANSHDLDVGGKEGAAGLGLGVRNLEAPLPRASGLAQVEEKLHARLILPLLRIAHFEFLLFG